MKSPIVKNGSVTLLKKIPVKKLIDSYKNSLDIDVRRFFKDLEFVELYICNATGYKFYAPLEKILGDSDFYEKLQNFDWYYMPWKWEHELFLKNVSKEAKILEIGSGGLGFIKKMNSEGFDVTGLELNTKSVKQASELGLKVLPEFIEEYANSFLEEYDIVCSFQVMEHISNIKSFLDASIKVLKKGGKLIACIPNNDSFIKFDKSYLMNHPPHHAGLWSYDSLSKLTEFFPIKVSNVFYEPLQKYHYDWYCDIMANRNKLNLFPFGNRFLRYYYRNKVKKMSQHIIGHSIMIEFEKL